MFADWDAACASREQLLVCGCWLRPYQRESGELSGRWSSVGAKDHRVPLLAGVGRQALNLAPPTLVGRVGRWGVAAAATRDQRARATELAAAHRAYLLSYEAGAEDPGEAQVQDHRNKPQFARC